MLQMHLDGTNTSEPAVKEKQVASESIFSAIATPLQALKEISLDTVGAVDRFMQTNLVDLNFENLVHTKSLQAAADLIEEIVDMDNVFKGQPTWEDFVEDGLDPYFFPLLEGNGNYLGLLVEEAFLQYASGFPLVFYFHEMDPIYTLIATNIDCFLHDKQAVSAEIDFFKQHLDLFTMHNQDRLPVQRSLSIDWLFDGDQHHVLEKLQSAISTQKNPYAYSHVTAQKIYKG
ncbi:MAG: hypothetical protein R3A45_02310 [Bdellovibrionota bacterium]